MCSKATQCDTMLLEPEISRSIRALRWVLPATGPNNLCVIPIAITTHLSIRTFQFPDQYATISFDFSRIIIQFEEVIDYCSTFLCYYYYFYTNCTLSFFLDNSFCCNNTRLCSLGAFCFAINYCT